MIAQPDYDSIEVFRRCFSKTKERPDLGAVVFDRASLSVVLGPHRWRSLCLLHEVIDRLHRHLALAGGNCASS
jgi:hypothetical protein